MWGDDKAWKFMDDLTRTSRRYTHSGSKPCRQAGAGEFPIGVSFEYRAVTTKKSGAPIDVIFPTEGLGWDLEASGIMKTTKKLDAAKSLMDWLASTPGDGALLARTSPCSQCRDREAAGIRARGLREASRQERLSRGRRRTATRSSRSG
jgi:ABC-type Fe3+ transport system substrate-binding protein